MKGVFVVAVTLLFFASQVPAVEYFVATYGDNSNDGRSVNAPWRTIQHAINRTGPGDTINIRAGTYRGSLLINTHQGGEENRYKTLRAYNSEKVYVKGSRLVTGWIMENDGIYRKEGWGVNSQQVFVNGQPLQQIGWPDEAFTDRAHGALYGPDRKYWEVGTGKADLVDDSFPHGAFYYDRQTGTLYVRLSNGEDPNSKVMEASYWTRPMQSRAPYVRLQGLTFLHSNSLDVSEYLSGVLIEGHHTIMEQCVVARMDFGGVAIMPGAESVIIRNSVITQNGNNGIATNHGRNFRITGNTITANNYRNFNAGWHAGGIKSAGISHGLIYNNDISYNRGDGIWWDVGGGDWGGNTVTISQNFLRFNNNGRNPDGVPHGNAAIHYEISKNGRIFSNVIIGGRRGIYLSASSDTFVADNTITNVDERGGMAGIELGGVPRAGYEASRNRIYRNAIRNTRGTWAADYRELRTVMREDAAGNYIDDNIYYRKGYSTVFALKGDPDNGYPHVNVTTLSLWKQRNSGGFDRNSRLEP